MMTRFRQWRRVRLLHKYERTLIAFHHHRASQAATQRAWAKYRDAGRIAGAFPYGPRPHDSRRR